MGLGGLYVIFYYTPPPPRGGRRKSAVQSWDSVHFYPRPPRGGRHELFDNSDKFTIISTHALREEGDYSMLSCLTGQGNFYPRPPRGGRRP